MRNVTHTSVSPYLLLVVLPLCALTTGCVGQVNPVNTGVGTGGNGGAGMPGAGGTGSPGTAGSAGSTGAVAVPCSGPADSRLVVAPQRIMRLTLTETLNTIIYLIDDTEAAALLTSGMLGQSGDDINDADRQFPPLQQHNIIDGEYNKLDKLAQHVSNYVLANYATLTTALAGCADVTDDCARMYLSKLAIRAYRRPLTTAEQNRLTGPVGVYAKLRSQVMNGYQITSTVQEATSYVVYALLSSPQMLWRWEVGNPAMASTAPAGIPLTDAELATHLSFFLTDQPPDDPLLTAVTEGSLRTNLTMHVDRLLASQAAKDWLRTIVETYYLINQLPKVVIDSAKFPIFGPGLLADMRTEAQKFLDSALWKGDLTDLLLSRKTFLNPGLAMSIYGVPVPAGATVTNFVETTLPDDRRAGLLTNAAFITSRGRSDGIGLVIPRGKAIASAVLCMPPPPPDDIPAEVIKKAAEAFDTQTAQEQVASRAKIGLCNSCHKNFDPYGLVLENFDTLGRWRDKDTLNMDVDGRTAVPAALGGGEMKSGVELAEKLAASPAFTNCMARTVLQYAMVDSNADVELPLLPEKAGCAAAEVVKKYESGGGKSFTDLVRATTASAAFVYRKATP